MTEQTQKHLNQLLTGVADGRQLQVSNGTSWLDVQAVAIATFVEDPHRFRLKPEDEVPEYLEYNELGDNASRELRDDEEWSGQGHWVVEDLPAGYRPLLVGERIERGDDVRTDHSYKGTTTRGTWEPAAGLIGSVANRETMRGFIARTKRPMPAPKRIPFTYETAVANGLLGDVVCRPGEQGIITALTEHGLRMSSAFFSYDQAAEQLTFLCGDPVAYRA